MEIPTLCWDALPKISRTQMQQLNTLATGKYGMDLRVLMEHAGRSLADLAQHAVPEGPVLIVAGRGNNGGSGMVAARLLAARGRSVWVVPTHEAENYSGVPKEQLDLLQHYDNIRVRSSLPKMKFSCAIDCAIGVSLEGPPRGRTLDVITVLNNMNGSSTVIALDVPTGIVADDGSSPGEYVHADITLNLILPKLGSMQQGEEGELYLADLGLPAQLFRDIGLDAPSLPAWLCELRC